MRTATLGGDQVHPQQQPAPTPERRQLFISYSHSDGEWVERLRRMLRPLEQRYGLERWDDSRIQAGDRWRPEIEKALESAQVALLMVSPDFLASEFVTSHELPPLFRAAEREGLRILWVPLRPSLWKYVPEIEQYQAVIPPDRTLAEMAEAEQERLARQQAAQERKAEQERLKHEKEESRSQEAERERLARERQEETQRQAREQEELQAREEAERWRAEAERLAREKEALERRAEQGRHAHHRFACRC